MKLNSRFYFVICCVATGYIFSFNGTALLLLHDSIDVRFHPIVFAAIWLGMSPVVAHLHGVSPRLFLKNVLQISALPLSLSIISPWVITDYTWLGISLLGIGICSYDLFMQTRRGEKKKRG